MMHTVVTQGAQRHVLTLVGPHATAAGSGAPGRDGRSAYELAVASGYTGTLAQWLESLHGRDGKDGAGGTGGASDMYLAWLLALQFSDPGAPASLGAIRWHDTVSTRVGGVDYYRVEPYFAHLAAIYALEADAAAARDFAVRWAAWWMAHRNTNTHTALVTYISADGRHAATALPGAEPPVTPDAEDATDSNLMLWLLLVARIVALFGADALPAEWPRHVREVYDYARTPAVRDAADGMTWALPTYPIKYLMDNVEVWAGIDAAAGLFALLGDDGRQASARAWAEQIRTRLQADPSSGGLWDADAGLWAVHKDGSGTVLHADLRNAYPDALAQVWPAIFGMDNTRGGYARVAAAWPDWTFGQVATAGGSADAALALAAAYAGRPLDARRWLLASAARKTPEGGFPYPFLAANAAMAAVAARAGLGAPATSGTTTTHTSTTVVVDAQGQPLTVIDGGSFDAPTADGSIDGGTF